MKPDVVVGVYVVAKPITPSFIPCKSNIWDDLCFGRNYGQPSSENKFAARELEFLKFK